MARYGFIIAAGKQSRFNSKIPKALSKVGNSTLLSLNVDNLNLFCDDVYVVCSKENLDYFKNLGYNIIPIKSGKGCGDAVMKALDIKSKLFNNLDTCFIQWGDSFQVKETYSKMIKEYSSRVIIPCNLEKNPYVSVEQQGLNVNVKFSKYGEYTGSEGFHDLSVFYGNVKQILKSLHLFRNKIYKNNKYVHKHGNEMQFLDVFNETGLNAEILDMKGIKSYSFNTVEELNEIKLNLL